MNKSNELDYKAMWEELAEQLKCTQHGYILIDQSQKAMAISLARSYMNVLEQNAKDNIVRIKLLKKVKNSVDNIKWLVVKSRYGKSE